MAEERRERSAQRAAVLRDARRIVVKVGSAVLADRDGLCADVFARLAADIARLRARGCALTVVTSAAIAAGRTALGLDAARSIPERQAAAAVGQIALMAEWRRAFAACGVEIAQILLDAEDLANRRRYQNASHCLQELHAHGVVPVVNENDTVAIDELKFGDNDNLSALVASLVEADLLVVLSDVGGLYDANPKTQPDAERIPTIARIDAAVIALASGGNALGTGGMRSKLLAARKAAAGGVATVIADGRAPGALTSLLDEHADIGTLILPDPSRLARRKHWIAFTSRTNGAIHCDAGATEAVAARGRSLLPSGVAAVSGRFETGACVRLIGPDGAEFARGLVSYGAREIERIAGKHSSEVEAILGYKMGDAVVHRDDLVLVSELDAAGAPGAGNPADVIAAESPGGEPE